MEYIVDRMKQEMKMDMKVIATGGLGRIIADETNKIDLYDRELTFKGLKVVYEKNK